MRNELLTNSMEKNASELLQAHKRIARGGALIGLGVPTAILGGLTVGPYTTLLGHALSLGGLKLRNSGHRLANQVLKKKQRIAAAAGLIGGGVTGFTAGRASKK